jgi:hypothetical protein
VKGWERIEKPESRSYDFDHPATVQGFIRQPLLDLEERR